MQAENGPSLSSCQRGFRTSSSGYQAMYQRPYYGYSPKYNPLPDKAAAVMV